MFAMQNLTAGQLNAIVKKLGGEEGALRFLVNTVEIVYKGILELVKSEIKVSVRERFVVAEHFKKGVAGIYYVSNNFLNWFGNKVEENIPVATLSSHKLTKSSVDGPIKQELGEGHETFLTWLFEKIEAQADGREGELLTNAYANIFYVEGRVVYARWFAGYGWHVYAYEVSDPYAWCADVRVFSRNVLRSSGTQESAQA